MESLAWCLVLLAAGGLGTGTLSHSTATGGKKLKSGLSFEKYRAFLGRLNCNKPLTTRSQWRIAYYTALALGRFVPLGLVQ